MMATIGTATALVTTGVTGATTAVAAAGPQPPVVVCTGFQTVTYSPPLTNTPQTITRTVTETLTCAPSFVLPGIFGGTRVTVTTSVQSCPPLSDPINLPGDTEPLIYHYSWLNNDPPNGSNVSSVGFVGTRPSGERVTTRIGSVVGGRYKDYGFLQVVEGITPDLTACSGAGIASTFGNDTVTFTVV